MNQKEPLREKVKESKKDVAVTKLKRSTNKKKLTLKLTRTTRKNKINTMRKTRMIQKKPPREKVKDVAVTKRSTPKKEIKINNTKNKINTMTKTRDKRKINQYNIK